MSSGGGRGSSGRFPVRIKNARLISSTVKSGSGSSSIRGLFPSSDLVAGAHTFYALTTTFNGPGNPADTTTKYEGSNCSLLIFFSGFRADKRQICLPTLQCLLRNFLRHFKRYALTNATDYAAANIAQGSFREGINKLLLGLLDGGAAHNKIFSERKRLHQRSENPTSDHIQRGLGHGSSYCAQPRWSLRSTPFGGGALFFLSLPHHVLHRVLGDTDTSTNKGSRRCTHTSHSGPGCGGEGSRHKASRPAKELAYVSPNPLLTLRLVRFGSFQQRLAAGRVLLDGIDRRLIRST